MLVPGGNLLDLAMRMLNPQTVKYFKYLDRTTNTIGYDVTTFNPGVDIEGGSVQPVPRDRYEAYGFDVSKNYILWYTDANVSGAERATSGDQVEVLGRRWQLTSENQWTLVDGWTGVTAIDIGPATS